MQNTLEMLSIDVESGMSATIFKESDPYWINLSGDVRFLDDGKRFLWTSERTPASAISFCIRTTAESASS